MSKHQNLFSTLSFINDTAILLLICPMGIKKKSKRQIKLEQINLFFIKDLTFLLEYKPINYSL